MTELNIYLVTFGQKYANQPHPVSSKIHPDGLVAVHAVNEEHARQIAFRIFGKDWSMVRPMFPGIVEVFPRGIIGQVNKDSVTLVMN